MGVVEGHDLYNPSATLLEIAMLCLTSVQAVENGTVNIVQVGRWWWEIVPKCLHCQIEVRFCCQINAFFDAIFVFVANINSSSDLADQFSSVVDFFHQMCSTTSAYFSVVLHLGTNGLLIDGFRSANGAQEDGDLGYILVLFNRNIFDEFSKPQWAQIDNATIDITHQVGIDAQKGELEIVLLLEGSSTLNL